jgi:hypothetical protein
MDKHTIEITAADYVALAVETGDAGYLTIATILVTYEREQIADARRVLDAAEAVVFGKAA